MEASKVARILAALAVVLSSRVHAASIDGLTKLRPGERVRVTTNETARIEGRFVAVRDDRIVLDDPAQVVPLSAVRTIAVRGRAAGKGAMAGGITGGLIAGVALGVAVGALCEHDCSGPSIAAGLVGAAVGGGTGALVGGVAGSALPDWRRVYTADEPEPHVGQAPARDPEVDRPENAGTAPPKIIGSLALHLGYGTDLDDAPRGGLGGRLRLAAELGAVQPALEIGYHGLGGSHVTTRKGRRVKYDQSVRHIGLAVAAGPMWARWRPYALAGAGLYEHERFNQWFEDEDDVAFGETFVGGSLGAGLQVAGTDRLTFGVEGRWHTSFDDLPPARFGGGYERWSMVTVTAGATLRW